MKLPEDDLAKIAFIFQKNQVRFMVIGARAAAFYGHIRATEDIDLLIDDSEENIKNAIAAIREIYPHITEELKVQDFYDSIVIKILDEPELDVSISAWSITFNDAKNDRNSITVEGINIPFVGLETLISSKLTERELDRWDVSVLREILKKQKDG